MTIGIGIFSKSYLFFNSQLCLMSDSEAQLWQAERLLLENLFFHSLYSGYDNVDHPYYNQAGSD